MNRFATPHFFCIGFIIGLACLLGACAQRPAVPSPPEPPGRAEALFMRAEEKFDAGAYEDALVLYRDYAAQYADQPLAAAALMKVGRILTLMRNYPEARATFERIISEYPDEAFAKDASVEILKVLYRQGAYDAVLEQAALTLEAVTSAQHIFQTYVVVGDAYLATGSPVEAVEFYAQAKFYASEADEAILEARMREAVQQLRPEDLSAFLNRSDSLLPLDFILYQLGASFARQQLHEQALAVLEEFNRRFPDHEKRREVAQMIDDIRRNTSFDRQTIGCLLPLSGSYQAFGQRAMRGIEIALDTFRSRAGQAPINIIVKDTGSDPGRTLQALQALHAAGAAAVIGPLVHVETAAREAQSLGIPIITITQKDRIPEIGDNVFRNFLTPRMQVRALVSFAVEQLGAMRFAVLYPEEVYGRTFMDLFWSELLPYGGRIVGAESYDPSETDFSEPIKRLVGLHYPVPEDLMDSRPEGVSTESHRRHGRSAGDSGEPDSEEDLKPIVDFDAIFIPESPKVAGLLIPQLAFYDVRDVILLGTNLWHSRTLLDIAGQYVQGAVLPDGFFAGSSSPLVRQFVGRYEAAYQEAPGYIEAILFDSAMILFDVVRRPEVRFRGDIRAALTEQSGFEGVTGRTRFDQNGEAVKQTLLLRIEGSEFVEVGRR